MQYCDKYLIKDTWKAIRWNERLKVNVPQNAPANARASFRRFKNQITSCSRWEIEMNDEVKIKASEAKDVKLKVS